MTQEASPASLPRTRMPAGATFVLALLRIAIGWHFLYEGTAKIFDKGWSAAEFLQASTGPLADHFRHIAADPALLKAVNYLNIAGLILIGAALMLGLFTRTAAFFGMVLLALYYLAYPPLVGAMLDGMTEGQYLLVNKNLIELIALLVILVAPAASLGLDGFFADRRRRRKAEQAADPIGQRPNEIIANLAPPDFSRRRILANLAGVPFVGGYVLAVMKRHWVCNEERILAAHTGIDARSGATLKFDFSQKLADLKGRPEKAKIGNVEFSRLILGGNLIGGWAHARDLIYVSKLIKAYHHRKKVWETFRLAEASGVNTILTNQTLCPFITDYWNNARGKIQFISDCGLIDPKMTMADTIRTSIDKGACACYIRGADTDMFVEQGNFDEIGKALDLMRKNRVPAGIGAHHLKSVQACVEKGLIPDFWVKTLHHTNYWSATKKDEHDNVWCDNPEETIAFMGQQRQPWIAFKVLAAGAIDPQEGFRYAFANGADFICVGMYDFQIIDDVNIAVGVLAEKDKLQRQRPWYA